MKNILRNIAVGLSVLTVAVSCDLNQTPVFDDSRAFVAVDQTAITVPENVGTVRIPVSIASVQPVKTAVAYSVLEGATAKEGDDYILNDESAVLSFDGKQRTAYIEIDIKEHKGLFTGAKKFSVGLIEPKGLELAVEKVCEVTISDLDHPLAEILGHYTAKGMSLLNKGVVEWDAQFYSDEKDIHTVWIDAIIPDFAGTYPKEDFRIYGLVSEDLNTITIQIGQSLKSKFLGMFDFVFYGCDEEFILDEGTVVLTRGEDGGFVSDKGFVAYGYEGDEEIGPLDIILPPVTFTR